ncbi:putative disease resistance protein RGA3 [Salvia hispanica]|uniref:putative disease resistance protein RGA3 n=1 Tax=Salvia hispanica TaxID=49212 RepID=UPI0020094CFD|nr:putative disease resistance protein RGA3 [Salvia hispanica]
MDGVAAAIEVVVQNLINVLKEEYSLIRGLDGDAQQLQRTLGMIQAFLNDAEKKSITQDAVKFWLRDLEAVAFDADNVLDELSYHLLHKKVKKMMKLKDRAASYFSSFNRSSRRRNMAHAIKKINAEFESMIKMATNVGLQSIIQNAPVVASHTSIETNSIRSDPIFVGRDDDVSNVVDMLTYIPRDQIISIVALVGMGGMGKTTLTRKVFNHERLKTFGSRIWVHVSQNFDPIGVYNKIHSTLASTATDRVERFEHEEVILNKLREALRAKTYLLVLDDVWNEDVPRWEDFINNMKGASSTVGNGIIITTRSKKVASIVNPFHIHRVNGLSDEQCWSIIKAKAFNGNAEVPSGFETIGKEIAKRCQGLPLAANVAGGVLHRSKSEQDWHSIKENWILDGEGGENITTILKLSFYHLSSPSLKKCFAYFSIFPKGWEIMKDELIELWMAEGFLQPSRRYDMESIGNIFFNVLLQNSLLQAGEADYYGRVCCVMHDLVHDLASSVSSNNNADGSTLVRYMFHEKESSRIPEEVSRNLRTLLLRGGNSGIIFSNFKCLHNLTLFGNNYKELPSSIRELIHLRNLNISHTSIVNISEWIGELHHLQTLRLELWELEKLPNTIKYLINLRHLWLAPYTDLPVEIGRLTSLQTLEYFKVGEEKGYRIEELGNLKNLKGSLEIGHLERVGDKEEAMKANLLDKSNLSKLVFSWDGERSDRERNDESVLEGLQPHANLKVLGISGFKGKRFPTWCEKMAVRDGLQGSWVTLDNLTRITLDGCSECEEIPMLEHLPNLKTLNLFGLKKARFINSSFNNLRNLGISDLKSLPKQLFCNNQNLSILWIHNCSALKELPEGLDILNSLEELTISDCKNLKSIGNPSGFRKYQGVLRVLEIEGCGELEEFPHQILESSAPTIETLVLEELRSLKNLPMLIDCLAKSSPRLEFLKITGVPNFMASGTIESWSFGRLKELRIDVSVKWSRETSLGIIETVDGILQGCCNSLTDLYFKGIEHWEWVPQSIQLLTSLDSLKLENVGGEELPQWLGNLSSLRELHLYGWNRLRCLPSVAARLTKLEFLQTIGCPELHIDQEWRNLRNLKISA